MDFEPSHEETMLADSVDAFGARHYPPSTRLKTVGADSAERRARWAEMAALGWLGLGIADDAGDVCDNDGYILALTEGFGRHLMLEPYVTRCVLIPALLTGDGLADTLRASVADGSVTSSLALGEPDAGFTLHHVATTAAAQDTGYVLSGVKDHAIDGADADWFLVPARTSGATADRDGISLFVVRRDAPGLTVERYRSIDDHHHARLRLDNVAVDSDALIGARDAALPAIEAAVERAIVAHLAEALGSMEAVAAAALEYLKTRHQFGKPLGTFQALQHRMVDINIACEEARSMVYHAAASLAEVPALRGPAIAAAKARVAQCGLYAARQAVQLHGGLGVSAELIVSHHLKRQMMLDMAYGNAGYQRQRFTALADFAHSG